MPSCDVDVRKLISSGGSDGTTCNVFRQCGHKKQFLAHLKNIDRFNTNKSDILLYT